jgi:hypothetical protein
MTLTADTETERAPLASTPDPAAPDEQPPGPTGPDEPDEPTAPEEPKAPAGPTSTLR